MKAEIWPLNIESARQVRREDNPQLKNLWECICVIRGYLDPNSKDFTGMDTNVILSTDEMIAAEILFRTGLHQPTLTDPLTRR